jgi:hypothetical protein
MTPSGIEAATFRFVAQHLNDCATAVPELYLYLKEIHENLIQDNQYPHYEIQIGNFQNKSVQPCRCTNFLASHF